MPLGLKKKQEAKLDYYLMVTDYCSQRINQKVFLIIKGIIENQALFIN